MGLAHLTGRGADFFYEMLGHMAGSSLSAAKCHHCCQMPLASTTTVTSGSHHALSSFRHPFLVTKQTPRLATLSCDCVIPVRLPRLLQEAAEAASTTQIHFHHDQIFDYLREPRPPSTARTCQKNMRQHLSTAHRGNSVGIDLGSLQRGKITCPVTCPCVRRK